mmetsp:Transcript_19251/g.29525  ORF Transcript_19251/g.29525 Transcript_19251/m.29525 type:complete len:93 (+) Transcript_19251:835-1113(+)
MCTKNGALTVFRKHDMAEILVQSAQNERGVFGSDIEIIDHNTRRREITMMAEADSAEWIEKYKDLTQTFLVISSGNVRVQAWEIFSDFKRVD